MYGWAKHLSETTLKTYNLVTRNLNMNLSFILNKNEENHCKVLNLKMQSYNKL